MVHSDLHPVGDSEDLDELVRAVANAPPCTPRPPSESPSRRVGTTLLGKYQIDSVLGAGGMAVVYKATHRNGAERAIKMLLPEHCANEDIRRRFRSEGRFANSVQHPGAVSVIDDDVTEDGAAFLVLELLRGGACDELARQLGGSLPVVAACAVGLQVLDVLQAAHQKGIIHRDIKPANLFVLNDGTVKVLDFGIARVRQTVATSGQATKTGALLGTPAFMAPEQALGSGSGTGVDERVDLWAVGATLFTLLSGATVSRPAHSLGTMDADVPCGVVGVVDKALEFDPARRWPSAGAMRSALAEASLPCFGGATGPAVLAALLASQGGSGQPSLARPKAGEVSPIAVPAAPTAVSEQPAAPPVAAVSRAKPVGLACAATIGLLAAGWFVALPRASRPLPPP